VAITIATAAAAAVAVAVAVWAAAVKDCRQERPPLRLGIMRCKSCLLFPVAAMTTTLPVCLPKINPEQVSAVVVP